MIEQLLAAALFRVRFLKGTERLSLARQLGTASHLAALGKTDWQRLLGRPIRAKIDDAADYLKAAAADLALAAKLAIGSTSYDQPDYPPLLREMPDPPLLLYYRGRLPDPEKPLVALVGTRRPTAASQLQAYRFGRDFARAGVAVVSGLALGIDAQAHRGNIDGGGGTVAVLGSGLDIIYPAANKQLARRILDNGGVLISEYPPGEPPLRYHFPERNRLIAALARSTIVVEAPKKSGALITAEFACESGRDLWVGSEGLVSPRGEGVKRLASEGALTASSAAMVLADWGWPTVEPGSPSVKQAVLGLDLALELKNELFGKDLSTT